VSETDVQEGQTVDSNEKSFVNIPKYTFLKRRVTNDQKFYEKMLSIKNNQERVSQNCSDNHLIPVIIAISIRVKITSTGEDGEKREPLHAIGEDIN
jgi:hypothetical protein